MAICGDDAPHSRDGVPGSAGAGALAGAVEVDGAVERVGGALEAAQHCCCRLKYDVPSDVHLCTQFQRIVKADLFRRHFIGGMTVKPMRRGSTSKVSSFRHT